VLDSQDQRLYRVAEVARLLGVSREWIRQLVQRGEIATVDFPRPGQKRILASEVQRLRGLYAQGKRTWQGR
jgi:excisionase family DNA binding protein